MPEAMTRAGLARVAEVLAFEPAPHCAAWGLAETSCGWAVASFAAANQVRVGDLAVVLQQGARLPIWLARRLGLWDPRREKGVLSGAHGLELGPVVVRGVVAEGLLYPISRGWSRDLLSGELEPYWYVPVEKSVIGVPGFVVQEFDDATAWLNIGNAGHR